MEELIDKLQNIEIMSSLLEENDGIEFKNETDTYINQIKNIVYQMENSLSKFKLSKEKCEAEELKMKKEKIIKKSLFPYYSIINECINNVPNDESGKKILENLSTINDDN